MNTKDSIFYQTTKIEGDALAHLTKLIEAAERGEDVGPVTFSREEQTSRLEQPSASQPQTDVGEDVEQAAAFSREVQTSRVAQPPASPTEPAAPASWVALHKRAFKLPPSRTLSAEQGSYETVRVPSSSVLAALSPDLIPPVAADWAAAEAAAEAEAAAADGDEAAPAQTLLDARITSASSTRSAAVALELDLSEEAIDTACAIFDRAETPTQATAALFAADGEQDEAFAVDDMGEPDPVAAPVPAPVAAPVAAASRGAWRLVALALLALALTLGAIAAW